MDSLGTHIRKLREDKGMQQRKLASLLDLDVAVLSKIENDNNFPKKRISDIIGLISKTFEVEPQELWYRHLSDEISSLLENEQDFEEILKITKKKIIHQRRTVLKK